jgi:hypothetical protein
MLRRLQWGKIPTAGPRTVVALDPTARICRRWDQAVRLHASHIEGCACGDPWNKVFVAMAPRMNILLHEIKFHYLQSTYWHTWRHVLP